MRPVRAGKSAASTAQYANSNASPARSLLAHPASADKARPAIIRSSSIETWRKKSELHLRGRLGGVVRRELRHWLVGAENRGRPNHGGNGSKIGVVHADRFDVVAARNRNAVL